MEFKTLGKDETVSLEGYDVEVAAKLLGLVLRDARLT